MGKINSIFKTIVAVAIVLIMAQGCVPVGGNTPTSGTFNVGILSKAGISQATNVQNKILVLDGDSILFSTDFTVSTGSGFSHNIFIKPLSNNVYEHIAYSGLFLPNTTINSTDTTKHWLQFANGNGSYLLSGTSVLYKFDLFTDYLPFNADRYIVFRKQKQNGYLYFWLKVRYTDDLNLHLSYTLNVLNGKYQMNSIVTGQ